MGDNPYSGSKDHRLMKCMTSEIKHKIPGVRVRFASSIIYGEIKRRVSARMMILIYSRVKQGVGSIGLRDIQLRGIQ